MGTREYRDSDEPTVGHVELVELVEHLRRGFAAADAEFLAGLWAGDENRLIYVAGERSRPLRTRGEIAQYYQDALSSIHSVDTAEVTDRSVDASGDGGHAFFRFRFAGRETASGERFDVNIQVTVVARRYDSRWALVHYHESSPGPV